MGSMTDADAVKLAGRLVSAEITAKTKPAHTSPLVELGALSRGDLLRVTAHLVEIVAAVNAELARVQQETPIDRWSLFSWSPAE
jgi:hypothetical protein